MMSDKYYWSEPLQGKQCANLIKTDSIIQDFRVCDVGYYEFKINQEGKCLYFALLETGRITAYRESIEEVKEIVDECWGTDTPWGKIDTMHVLYTGIYNVETASHGGIMVHPKTVKELLSEDAQKCGSWFNGFLCFEEDCAAPVAIREFLDKGIMDAPVNSFYKEGEYSTCINDSIKKWNPDYWKAYEKRTAEKTEPPKPKQKKPKDREER